MSRLVFSLLLETMKHLSATDINKRMTIGYRQKKRMSMREVDGSYSGLEMSWAFTSFGAKATM